MRLKINFSLNGKPQQLPLNYQYPVSSWIYKVLSNADEEFATVLHELGYRIENGKTFKLFTFSQIGFPQHTWKIIPKSDRMQVWARKGWITVSFHLPEQTEKFVMGLFKEQKVYIGDKISGIAMQVESIEALSTILPEGEEIKVKTLTPIVLGLNIEGEKNEQYVTPLHSDYKRIFLQNLVEKYAATGKNGIDINNLDFNITKLYPRTSLQIIKAGTSAETKVKGYYYEFQLNAPQAIIETGLNAGFGSMNSLGFGFCEVILAKKL